jgi:uncharacterized protein
MSGSLHTWYSLPDLDRLAERGAVLDGEIELKRLTRLSDLLHVDGGRVRASLRFRQRRGGRLIVEMECEATLQLICQRCLEPLAHPLLARVETELLETESVETRLPEECEPFFLDGGRFLPAQLIEDELIVSLPLVPRHARLDQCGRLARSLESQNNEAGGEPDGAPPTNH